jgi:hypothetical protein
MVIKTLKLDKFFITTLIVIVALIAYAIFFASPAFEALGSAANNIAVGLIAVTTITYTLTLSIVLFAKRSKTNSLKINYKQPLIARSYSSQQAEKLGTQKVNAATATLNVEESISENKIERITQLNQPPSKFAYIKQEVNMEKKTIQINQPIQQPTKPIIVEHQAASSRIFEKEQKEDEAVTGIPKLTTGKANKLVCSSCKKRFSTPLYSVDYSSNKPQLTGHCPYCNTVVVTLSDSTQQGINSVEVEEYFEKRGSSFQKV